MRNRFDNYPSFLVQGQQIQWKRNFEFAKSIANYSNHQFASQSYLISFHLYTPPELREDLFVGLIFLVDIKPIIVIEVN